MRRSHAAVFAVTPAHWSGDGSRKVTRTVVPVRKASTLPTERQVSEVVCSNGPRRNPTTGIPTAAAARADSAMLIFDKNARRAGLTGTSCASGCTFSVAINHCSDPALKREGDDYRARRAKQVRRHEAEENKRNA